MYAGTASENWSDVARPAPAEGDHADVCPRRSPGRSRPVERGRQTANRPPSHPEAAEEPRCGIAPGEQDHQRLLLVRGAASQRPPAGSQKRRRHRGGRGAADAGGPGPRVQHLGASRGGFSERPVDQPPAACTAVEAANEEGAVRVVEDGLRVDRVGARSGGDHAAHSLQPLGDRDLVVQVALPVEVLDKVAVPSITARRTARARSGRPALRAEPEVLVLERVGQLVREGVVELLARLDQPRDDDQPPSRVVVRAADPVEAALRVRAEAELRRKQPRELVERRCPAAPGGGRGARRGRLRSRPSPALPLRERAGRAAASGARSSAPTASGSARNRSPRIRSTRRASSRSERPQRGLRPRCVGRGAPAGVGVSWGSRGLPVVVATRWPPAANKQRRRRRSGVAGDSLCSKRLPFV